MCLLVGWSACSSLTFCKFLVGAFRFADGALHQGVVPSLQTCYAFWPYSGLTCFFLILTVTIISLHNINRLAFEMASSSVLGNGAMRVWNIRTIYEMQKVKFCISNSNCDFCKDNLPIMYKKSCMTYGLPMKTAFSTIRLHHLTRYAISFITI